MPADHPTAGLASPLDQSTQALKGVSPARFEQLRRLGLVTVRDLLFHFPRSYEDLTDVRPIAGLSAEAIQTVQGEVVEIGGKRLPDGRPVVSVVLCDDGKHCLEGIWFNQPYASSRFRYGQRLSFSGKPKWFRDHWTMTHPRVQPLDSDTPADGQGIVPIYPLTEDLKSEQLRPLIRRAVEQFALHVVEVLPPEMRLRRALPDVQKALRDLHFPLALADAEAARRRFVFEEFLILQLALALRRRELRDRQRAPVLAVTPAIDARIRRLFAFQLTNDQNQAVADICRDLASERPMQRLLQADVGAGKTAVAVYALLAAVANKHQAVLAAPTEVLARQHWNTLEGYLSASKVRRLLLTGGKSTRERRAALNALRAGEVDLVVGTQALMQEDVQFARLGLVVIDEQHKFGVNQRARVRMLGVDPHYLVMTATPIPRTLALTVFGDLDTTTIREQPPGRQPVQTRWATAKQRDRVYDKLREGLAAGRQAFLVCPLVAESEKLDLKAAEKTYEEMRDGPFRDARVGLLHGRLQEKEKDAVMDRFRAGAIDLLVCTSVVEVGVDVPNATLLVVEHAERFGLSQLHQMRGRVCRGPVAGECYVFADPTSEDARQRIRAFVKTTDGFALAEQDAKLRGIGELFGTHQHGGGDLRVGDLSADAAILREARKDAFAIVTADAGLRWPEHELLRKVVLDRYGRTLDLAQIG